MILKCNQQVAATIFELRAATLVICEFARCKVIIQLWVESRISLDYIKSALSIYIVSSLRVKQSKSNKVMWYIFQLWYTPESNRKIYCDLNGNELEKYANVYPNIYQLQKPLFTHHRMTILQILESSQENYRGGVQL